MPMAVPGLVRCSSLMVLAVLLADVVNGTDIRMVERRCGLSLALEAAQGLWVFGDFVR